MMIARHKGQELSDEELKEAFSVFDVDDIGFITGVSDWEEELEGD